MTLLARRVVKSSGSRSDVTLEVERNGVFRFYQDDDMVEVRFDDMHNFLEALRGLGLIYRDHDKPRLPKLPRPSWRAGRPEWP